MKNKVLKKLLATVALLLCSMVAIAETITVNGIAYEVDATEKTATVIAKESGKYSGNIVIPETVEHNGEIYSVTTIGNYAFSNCPYLTSVTIGNSVTTIGECAFADCFDLTSVTIPNSVTTIGIGAFEFCTVLTNVIIPNSVTTIGNEAFLGCIGLTSITIPNSVTTIEISAFYACTGLTNAIIGNGVTTIGTGAFGHCTALETVVIGEGVKTIDRAFENCENLTNVYCLATSVPTTDSRAFNNTDVASATLHVPEESIDSYKSTAPWSGFGTIKAITELTYEFNIIEKTATVIASNGDKYSGDIVILETVEHNGEVYNVTAIGNGAFDSCYGLTSVTIPNSVTTIGNDAFYGCTGLTSITIPNSVTTIGNDAFSRCTGLTSITIPNSVTTIGSSPFSACRRLTAVHISDLSAWCNIDFYRSSSNPLYFARNLYLNGNLVTDLVIPDDVTEIKDYAFYYCSGLTSVTIPNSVTTIGESAFYNCTGLTSATIGDGVTAIGESAFYNCTGLTSTIIGDGVTTIGESAFYNCTGLTSTIIGDLSAWCNIDFGGSESNPLYYAHNLYLNGNLVTDLVIPGDITEIKKYAFYGCTGLTSAIIGDGVTTIGSSAFYGCSGLTSVTIPNSVTTIRSSAFDGCTGLTAVHISDLSAWCNIDFVYSESNPLYYAHNLYLNGNLVTDLVIPGDITEIKKYAFYGCSGLTSVTIPNSVTTIRSSAFDGCTGLKSITIPNSATEIEESTFSGCTEISDIYSYITAEDLFSISNNTFDVAAYENATLYVPFGTAGIYSTTSAWNKFVNIVEDDTMPMSLALVYNGVLEYASSILDDTAFGSHGLITSEAQLSTNAQEPTEGPIANLLDNDFMTFFHSTWSATNTYMAYHYLQIDLGEPLDAVALKYSKRTGTGFMVDGSPVKVRVFATNDTNGEWNEVGVHPLSYTHAADTVAVGYKAIVLDNSYRHIRLQVEQTVSNERDKHNLYFNLSEIGAWEARFEEEHVAYKDVPSNLMDELKAALSEAKSELMAGNDDEATAGRLYNAFEAVKNYVPTGIEDVFDNSDANHSNLYYDLQGRVVENPSRGIYIHNGKKVFIK